MKRHLLKNIEVLLTKQYSKMENQNTKLSIVTINLNNKDGLKKTLKSIDDQSNKNFEYLVIDGNSSDGSQDLINNSAFIDIKISEKIVGSMTQ